MHAGVVALGRVFEGWRSRDQHRYFLCCTHVRPDQRDQKASSNFKKIEYSRITSSEQT